MSAFGNSDNPMNNGVGSLGTFGSGSNANLTGTFTDSGNLNNVGAGAGMTGLGTNYDSSGNLLNVGTNGTGPGAGWQNGNLSFAMPSDSMGQLASQAQNVLGMGSKIAQPEPVQHQLGSPGGKLRVQKVDFSAPVVDNSGAPSGSANVNSLIALMKKYTPGAKS